MTKENKSLSRRQFFGNAAAISAFSALGMGYVLNSCSGPKDAVPPGMPPLLDQAPEGRPLKAGLIGCGGRGTGAALNFLAAGPGLSIGAMADLFEDRMAGCRKELREKAGVEVADDKVFLGF